MNLLILFWVLILDYRVLSQTQLKTKIQAQKNTSGKAAASEPRNRGEEGHAITPFTGQTLPRAMRQEVGLASERESEWDPHEQQ